MSSHQVFGLLFEVITFPSRNVLLVLPIEQARGTEAIEQGSQPFSDPCFDSARAGREDQVQTRIPAMVPVINAASVPASIALNAIFARSPRLEGAMPPMPPSWMPIEPKFANPHSA